MNNNHRALHETFARHFIGFEPLLRFAENTHEFNFPPHNIERITEDHYRLTLAIAGFAKNEINLSLHEGALTVTGSKEQEEDDSRRNYVYKGIAFRNFSRTFKIGDSVEVIGAKMEHGLLTIDLERQRPEAEKPKLIPIK